MLILGIDPGTRITGYGLIRQDKGVLHLLDFGCIRPPVDAPLAQRYHFLFEAIQQLLVRHRPDALVVETQYVGKNVQSTIKLAMARAAILIAASAQGVPTFEYAPSHAKRAVTGSGSADKVQIQKMMQLLLRLPSPPEPEDAADALALAICHANKQRTEIVCTPTSKGS